ncbi:hypothetical protein [Poseidonibacter lekithochrous]|uniref:hypothetical protein n=1 Tax=Poseidonibacter lekithochrous TaxID=1904463 RepID=UPI000D3B37C8|nr:hypothetical protein [Poseidonibacter lekithochrous]
MKYINSILFFFIIISFTACSSKKEISLNSQINSISLDKNIAIANVPKTVKSPISIGLGLGGYVSKHVGINVGTSVRPDIKNSDALNLKRGIEKFNINLEELVFRGFSRAINEDKFYKNKFVPFGANHTIHLFVSKYEMDDSFISSTAYAKLYIELKVLDQNDNVLYTNYEVNDSIDSSFSQAQIYSKKQYLEKALNDAILNTSKKLIKEMKSK